MEAGDCSVHLDVSSIGRAPSFSKSTQIIRQGWRTGAFGSMRSHYRVLRDLLQDSGSFRDLPRGPDCLRIRPRAKQVPEQIGGV